MGDPDLGRIEAHILARSSTSNRSRNFSDACPSTTGEGTGFPNWPRFPSNSGRFPQLLEPSKGYHGVRFYETFGDFAYIMKARVEGLRDFGPALSPFNSFLFLQGLETLKLRMDCHSSNALRVAEFLSHHHRVAWVNYPRLEANSYSALAQRYLPLGAGGVLTFGIQGGLGAGRRFIESLQLFSHLANIGDAKSLVIHPASTTHQQLTKEEREAGGIASLRRPRMKS